MEGAGNQNHHPCSNPMAIVNGDVQTLHKYVGFKILEFQAEIKSNVLISLVVYFNSDQSGSQLTRNYYMQSHTTRISEFRY